MLDPILRRVRGQPGNLPLACRHHGERGSGQGPYITQTWTQSPNYCLFPPQLLCLTEGRLVRQPMWSESRKVLRGQGQTHVSEVEQFSVSIGRSGRETLQPNGEFRWSNRSFVCLAAYRSAHRRFSISDTVSRSVSIIQVVLLSGIVPPKFGYSV